MGEVASKFNVPELQRRRAENEHDVFWIGTADLLDLIREHDEARQRGERLREALLKYGEHQPGCHIAEEDIFGPLDDCSCGLRAALAADQPAEEYLV